MLKYIVPIMVLVVGFSISYWAYDRVRAVEIERAQVEFDRRAANISSILASGIKGYSTAAEALKNITSVSLNTSTEMEPLQAEDYMKLRDEWGTTKLYFNQIAKDMVSSFPGIRSLGWALSSPYSDLGKLELAGKFLISPDYDIHEINSDGGSREVVERADHFPVFYIEPMEISKVALGIDLSFSRTARRAIIEARDTGKTISTPPIGWIKGQTGQLGFCIFDAVYKKDTPLDTVEDRRENLYAISFSVILIDDMLNASFEGLREAGLDYFIFTSDFRDDVESPQALPVFASNGDPKSWQGIHEAASVPGLQSLSVVNVLGRDWLLCSYPQSDFHTGYELTGSMTPLVTGVFISMLLAYILFRAADKTQRITALVAHRTQELSITNENLEREMASRIEAHKHREELESQLLQSQKMESIGQLAGGIAHDFNNLLQAILGYGEMALIKVGPDSPAREDLEETMKAGERARVLVRQLLAFSRRQVLELNETDLNIIIADLLKMIQRVIGEHITLHFVSCHNLGIVLADRGQIEQIIMNLCVNARDAMGESGKLTIETSAIELNDEFCETNAWAIPGQYVMIRVTDMGCGMDEETQKHIFEPFFTTKDTGQGTGLGLSTVFGIVQQHNGMVHVESEVGVGTTFSIYLPEVKATMPLDEEITTTYPQGGTETILFADDDELVSSVTEDMLLEAGYTVLKAGDGEEAIRLFDEHKDNIDLALLDVVMPKLGGKAVREHILKERPDFPILFSSGYSSDAIHTNFVLDAGMYLIQKPYPRRMLLQKLREVIANV